MARENPYLDGASEWSRLEAKRLVSMDMLLAEATRADLGLVLASRRHDVLLDIGAGTGTAVEELCQDAGVMYVALDANPAILKARNSPYTVSGLSDAILIPDQTIGVTYARAVHAWNPRPVAAIQEQLRVTRSGGVAVMTDFDWSKAGPGRHTGEQEAHLVLTLRNTLTGVLQAHSFNPNYGAQARLDIATAMELGGVEGICTTELHLFPEGDYSQLLSDATQSLIGQLESAPASDEVNAVLNILRAALAEFMQLPEHSFNIPVLVTQKVKIA